MTYHSDFTILNQKYVTKNKNEKFDELWSWAVQRSEDRQLESHLRFQQDNNEQYVFYQSHFSPVQSMAEVLLLFHLSRSSRCVALLLITQLTRAYPINALWVKLWEFGENAQMTL